MRTLKGLIALLLVMAAVFSAVVIYNSKTEPGYEAKVMKQTLANTVIRHTAARKMPGITGKMASKKL